MLQGACWSLADSASSGKCRQCCRRHLVASSKPGMLQVPVVPAQVSGLQGSSWQMQAVLQKAASGLFTAWKVKWSMFLLAQILAYKAVLEQGTYIPRSELATMREDTGQSDYWNSASIRLLSENLERDLEAALGYSYDDIFGRCSHLG